MPSEVERAIVLALLCDESPRRRSRRALIHELRHIPLPEISKAILRLDADGVLERLGEEIWASRPTRRLDELGLIAV
jgi:hypothetical protein